MKKSAIRWFFLLLALAATAAGTALGQQDQAIEDKDVKVVQFQDLKYPLLARSAGIEGAVVLRLKLDRKGNVIDVAVLSGNPLLAHTSAQSAKDWRFESNNQNAVILVYKFRLEGLCPPHVESSQLLFYPPNFVAVTSCQATIQP